MTVWRPCFATLLLALTVAMPTSIWSQSNNQNTDKVQALQKQLDEMKAQMANVQAQITELSGGAQPATPVAGATSAPAQVEEDKSAEALKARVTPAEKVDQVTAEYQTNSQDQIAAPRVDNAPLDPRFPGYFRLPGTQTLLRIGGYFRTDFIYDLKPAGNAESFVPATFPIPQTGVNNNTVSVRPTRLNLDFLIPVGSSSGRFFIEADFFGTNATTPRLRHAYAQMNNLLIGQTFTNFMDVDAGPDTLDFQGPNSWVIIRNPQFRYTIKLTDKTNFAVSVEKASSDVAYTTPTFSALPNSPTPDFGVKLRHDMSYGHIQIASIFRDVSAYFPAPSTKSGSAFGWGVNFTGAFRFLGKDNFVYQAAYGAGYERYVNDTSGLGTDAAPANTANPYLKAVPLTAVYGGYQHYWAKRWRSSLVYGFAQTQNTDLQVGSSFHQSNYSAANLIWNPLGSVNVGGEVLYGWIVKENNTRANDTRFLFSAKYNFVKSGTK